MHHVTLKRIVLSAAVGLCLLAAAPATSQAQHYATYDAAEWAALEQQLDQNLQSEVAQIRVEAMQQIMFFATHHAAHIDFAASSARLLDLYASSAHEGTRALAMVALHAIGDDASMRYLAELAQDEPSAKLQQRTRAAVAAHFHKPVS